MAAENESRKRGRTWMSEEFNLKKSFYCRE